MKILQILPALQQGGVERGTLEIAQALHANGIDNLVASAGGPLVKSLEKLGVKHITLPLASKNPFVVKANAKRLAECAKAEGVTLMHVRSRAPAWSTFWASQICGIPWISTFHGVYGTKPEFLKIPYNRVMLKGLKTICVSDYVLNHVLETYHPNPEQLIRIHRGADTHIFRPDVVQPNTVIAKKCQQYGFPETMPIILLPGRLTFWKGQTVLLEAVKRMRHRDIGILFVGSDQGRTQYSDYLRSLANKLPSSCKVLFKDHTREIQKVYAMSDIVVNASSAQPEAFGRTIPEAQAMGIITVATAHGGACETIQDGVTGFLVPPNDYKALAKKLDEILDMSEAQKQAIRAASIKSVQDNFSTDKMCAATIELYRSLS